MVSEQLRRKIVAYVRKIDQPYLLTENVSPHGRAYVGNRYLPACLAASEPCRERIIDELHLSWQVIGTGHQQIDDWKRAVKGACTLFLFTSGGELRERKVFQALGIDGAGPDVAVDVLVRISRWFHTQAANLRRMQPYAERLVRGVWGDIEDLNRMERICQPRDHGPIRSAPPPSSACRPALLFHNDMTAAVAQEQSGHPPHAAELVFSPARGRTEWHEGPGAGPPPAGWPRLWYCGRDQGALGPFTLRQLQAVAKPQDMVWRVGWPAWVGADVLTEGLAYEIEALDG